MKVEGCGARRGPRAGAPGGPGVHDFELRVSLRELAGAFSRGRSTYSAQKKKALRGWRLELRGFPVSNGEKVEKKCTPRVRKCEC